MYSRCQKIFVQSFVLTVDTVVGLERDTSLRREEEEEEDKPSPVTAVVVGGGITDNNVNTTNTMIATTCTQR